MLTALTDTSSPSSTQCLHCLLEGFTASHHVADNVRVDFCAPACVHF